MWSAVNPRFIRGIGIHRFDATRMVVVASSVRSEVRAALAADGETNDRD